MTTRKQKTRPLPLAGRGWGGGRLRRPNRPARRRRVGCAKQNTPLAASPHPSPSARPSPSRGGFSSQQHPRAAAGSPEGKQDRRREPRAIRPARGTRVGWRKQKSKARSGRVPRRGVFAMSSLGTGPLRDRPRTGFRTGHLMKRGAPHTGFSPRADLPSALSASRACRERVGLPHPSFARRLARCPCRMGEGIMRGVAIPRISFLWLRGVRCSAPGGRLAERESPGAIKTAPRPAAGSTKESRRAQSKKFRSKARGLGRPRASRPCRPSARSNTQSSPSLICRWFSLAPSQ